MIRNLLILVLLAIAAEKRGEIALSNILHKAAYARGISYAAVTTDEVISELQALAEENGQTLDPTMAADIGGMGGVVVDCRKR